MIKQLFKEGNSKTQPLRLLYYEFMSDHPLQIDKANRFSKLSECLACMEFNHSNILLAKRMHRLHSPNWFKAFVRVLPLILTVIKSLSCTR